MKAHFSGLVVVVLWLTATPARALNDEWLKDDQSFLQNQISQDQNDLAQLENVKQSANISKLNIAAGNASPSDYVNVANWEMQKHQYHHLQHQMDEAQSALRKVNRRIGELGTTRPPQQHDPYSNGGCGRNGGCGGNGQTYYERSSPDQNQTSAHNTQSSQLKHSQSRTVHQQTAQSTQSSHLKHSQSRTVHQQTAQTTQSSHLKHSQSNMPGHQQTAQVSTHGTSQHHTTANKKKRPPQ
jgi:hypothetical protein